MTTLKSDRDLIKGIYSCCGVEKETTVEEVMALYPFMDRSTVVGLLMGLAQRGFGRFKIGRRGKRSRVIWRGDPGELLRELDERIERAKNLARHTFLLRSGFAVRIELPLDITEAEIDRLQNWIRSLPFASPNLGGGLVR